MNYRLAFPLFSFLFIFLVNHLIGQTGIGTSTPDASAQLDVSSTTMGFLPPRMTEAERDAISSPADGLVIYQTDGTAGLYVRSSGVWSKLSSSETNNALVSEDPSNLTLNFGDIIFNKKTRWVQIYLPSVGSNWSSTNYIVDYSYSNSWNTTGNFWWNGNNANEQWIWSFSPLNDCYLTYWDLNAEISYSGNSAGVSDLKLYHDNNNDLTDGFGEIYNYESLNGGMSTYFSLESSGISPNPSILLKSGEVYRFVISEDGSSPTNGTASLEYSSVLNSDFAIYATDLGFVKKTSSGQFSTISGSPVFRLGFSSDDSSGAFYNLYKAPNSN